jgi:hypothetical protein
MYTKEETKETGRDIIALCIRETDFLSGVYWYTFCMYDAGEYDDFITLQRASSHVICMTHSPATIYSSYLCIEA